MPPTTIRELIESWNASVRSTLEPHFPCQDNTIVQRLLRYEELLKPNFVPWMATTWVGCQSHAARTALANNAMCEIREDHPAMLSRYVDQADNRAHRHATGGNIGSVTNNLRRLNELIVPDSAMTGLIVIMLLENASLVFILEMKRWGEVLGFTDFEYVDKHGSADIAHSDELCRAVEAEANDMGVDLPYMISTYSEEIDLVTRLLLHIFGE